MAVFYSYIPEVHVCDVRNRAISMATVFVSYSGRREPTINGLVEDIEALGHHVWFDKELSGGQVWWDHILEQIRINDIFVLALDPISLESEACLRECKYADDLHKPLLPVLISDEVSTSLLPEILSKIQFVDYRDQDRQAVFRLARAFAALPAFVSLPEPLPTPPDIPLSYLGSLAEKIDSASEMGYEQQSALIFDLKRALQDPRHAEGARTLLSRLRKRRDLFATCADEIDDILRQADTSKKSEGGKRTADENANHQQERSTGRRSKFYENNASLLSFFDFSPVEDIRNLLSKGRIPLALAGFFIGIFLGSVSSAESSLSESDAGAVTLITGLAGAIAAAIAGPHKWPIVLMVIGAIVGYSTVFEANIGSPFAQAEGVVFGSTIGAVFGAIVGTIFRVYRERSSGP